MKNMSPKQMALEIAVDILTAEGDDLYRNWLYNNPKFRLRVGREKRKEVEDAFDEICNELAVRAADDEIEFNKEADPGIFDKDEPRVLSHPDVDLEVPYKNW